MLSLIGVNIYDNQSNKLVDSMLIDTTDRSIEPEKLFNSIIPIKNTINIYLSNIEYFMMVVSIEDDYKYINDPWTKAERQSCMYRFDVRKVGNKYEIIKFKPSL